VTGVPVVLYVLAGLVAAAFAVGLGLLALALRGSVGTRWAARLPWLLLLLALVWGGAAAALRSDGENLLELCLFCYGALGLGSVILALGVQALRRREPRAELPPLGLGVLVLAAAVVERHLDLVTTARFELSRDALEAAAAEVRAGRELQTPARVGWYRIRYADEVDGAVRFVVGTENAMDGLGFVHSPGGEPRCVGEDRYWRLDGPWWLWARGW
jgi:hypothetical protein